MKKALLFILFSVFSVNLFFAQQEKNPLTFELTVNGAYHPQSDYVAGPTHFAPLTNAYESIKGCVLGKMNYVIPTPLGEHWLLKNATLKLQANVELSPVSFKPGFFAEFTPLPFLVFTAGAEVGTAWDAFGALGVAKFNGTEYISYKPFTALYNKFYAQGTFQFDTEALWPGEWHHIQFLYTYQTYYEGLSKAEKGELWYWQSTPNKANGFNYYQSIVFTYQMPLVLSRIGVMTELTGHYKDSDYKGYENYKGDFMEVGISPLCQLTFNEKNMCSIFVTFRTRRSFEENHTSYLVEPFLTYAGTEWFFQRFAFSYIHSF